MKKLIRNIDKELLMISVVYLGHLAIIILALVAIYCK